MIKYKLISILIFLIITASCSPKITGLGSEGRVIYSDTDRVFVIFPEVVNDRPAEGAWFYHPGATRHDTTGYKVQLVITKK